MRPRIAQGNHNLAHPFELADFVEKIIGAQPQASPACGFFHAMRQYDGDHRWLMTFDLFEQFNAVANGDIEHRKMRVAQAYAVDRVACGGGATDHPRHVING